MYETEGKPDYKGSRDEIVRLHIESEFERKITKRLCCGSQPWEMFKSCHDYFIKCGHCGVRTKTYRHLYQAKQAWNREEIINDTQTCT